MYERLGDFNFPTQIIWGTKDSVVLYSGHEALLDYLPQATLVSIEGGKHSITYKEPTKVGKSLASFLEKISS
jgi:pimeloyl-ACP methyl ester carboxylesterase